MPPTKKQNKDVSERAGEEVEFHLFVIKQPSPPSSLPPTPRAPKMVFTSCFKFFYSRQQYFTHIIALLCHTSFTVSDIWPPQSLFLLPSQLKTIISLPYFSKTTLFISKSLRDSSNCEYYNYHSCTKQKISCFFFNSVSSLNCSFQFPNTNVITNYLQLVFFSMFMYCT